MKTLNSIKFYETGSGACNVLLSFPVVRFEERNYESMKSDTKLQDDTLKTSVIYIERKRKECIHTETWFKELFS